MKNIKNYTDHLRESMETPEELGQVLIAKLDDDASPDIEEVKRLIQAGADLRARDFVGWTPLRRAAAWGHTEAAKALIAAGADLEAKDRDGWTALHCAAAGRRTEAAKALIGAGADISTAFDSLDKLEKFFKGDISWIPRERLPPEWRKLHRSRGAFGRF